MNSRALPPLPKSFQEQYGLQAHMPRCRAVRLAEATGRTDGVCDCGASGAPVDPVISNRAEAAFKRDRWSA